MFVSNADVKKGTLIRQKPEHPWTETMNLSFLRLATFISKHQKDGKLKASVISVRYVYSYDQGRQLSCFFS